VGAFGHEEVVMEDRPDPGDAPQGSAMASPEPWDLVADGYAQEVVPWGEHFADIALELADLTAPAHIVDVATGPGTLALLAARRGLSVSALDFSEAMIAALRRRADEAGLEIADVRVGDGQALPWDDDSFDAAFSMAGLIFFPDRDAGFRELRRVLRPGRRAVVSSNADLPPIFLDMLEAISGLLPDLPLSGGKMPLADADEFAAEMSAAGFGDVMIETAHHTIVDPSIEAFWDKTQRSAAPLVLLRNRLGDERWAEIAGEVLAKLRERHGGGPVDEHYVAHLGAGSK
jgi:SAM-dependent methyltransferase